MAERDPFSIQRPLDAPVGIPQDFLGGPIEDPALAALAASPILAPSLARDTMPLPSTRDREGYYGERHFEYWLSGLHDYLTIQEACPTVTWDDASLLDFGGATGRVARHFYAHSTLAEVMICDININNVTWVLDYLPSGVSVFKNGATPSLPLPDNTFDVVTAFSVFTHMNEHELAWLYELRRILKPHGILYATVHNDDTWRILPSTWVFQNVLMTSAHFRAVYQPGQELAARLTFDYSTDLAYNCNTFHPNTYLHRVWGKIFAVRAINPLCHSYQSAVVLQKVPSRSVVMPPTPLVVPPLLTEPAPPTPCPALQESRSPLALAELSEAELLALIPDIATLIQRHGTESWWMKQPIFAAFEAYGLHVTQDHAYTPQPTVASLSLDLWEGQRYANQGWALDMEQQRALFGDIAPFTQELTDVPRQSTADFYWDNHLFPNFDACVYYGLCRHVRPATILDIGGDFSTPLAGRAAYLNGTTQVRCIQPYPTSTLRAVREPWLYVLEQAVQDVPLAMYSSLQANDIVFINTSHVSKIGSDLHHILFQILPILPSGVFVHFNSIFLPHEYPHEWVVERNWFWNEQYLLLAFLMYNPAFRVVLTNHHFLYTSYSVAEQALQALALGPLHGASLWLQKVY